MIPSDDQPHTDRPRSRILVGLLLVVVAFALHGRTGGHRFFVGEEPESLHPFSIEKIAATSAAHAAAVPRADGDQPVARLAHRALIASGTTAGLRAERHRTAGAVVHALTSLLVLVALWRIVPNYHVAVIAAFAFALHPLTVEPVAWISMRGRLFAGLFGMLALVLWTGERGAFGRRVALAVFVLALASHPAAAPLPLLFLCLDARRVRVQPGRVGRGFVLTIAGALSIGAVVLAWRALATSGLGANERLTHAALAVGSQALRAVFPHRLSFTYAHPALAADGATTASVVAWVVFGLAFAFALRSVVRHRSVIALGALWFLAFALVAALLPYGRSFAPDRDAYLALPGLLVALFGAVSELSRRLPKRIAGALPAIVGVLLVATAGRIAWRRADEWAVPAHVVERAIELQPTDPVAHETSGFDLLRRGKLTDAENAFRRALELAAASPGAHVGLAHVHIRRPSLDAAEAELAAALAHAPMLPTANERLGYVLHRRGDTVSLERSAEHYARATTSAPYFGSALARAAMVSAFLRRFDEARDYAARAIECAPAGDARDAWFALGLVAEQEQDVELAIENYERALAVEPDYADALARVGNLYAERGEHARALERLERAYYVRPLDTTAHYPLAGAYREVGRIDDAIEFYGRALEANPRHMRSLAALARLYFDAGRWKEAREQVDRALEFNPNHTVALELLARLSMRDGRWAAALTALKSAFVSNMTNQAVGVELVRLLAAAPDDDVRNGEEALRRARNWIAANGEDAPTLAALAAALAETGDFGGAVDAAGRALRAADAQDADRATIERELELYRGGRPLRLEAQLGSTQDNGADAR